MPALPHTSDPGQTIPMCLGLPSANQGVAGASCPSGRDSSVRLSVAPSCPGVSLRPHLATLLFPPGPWGRVCGRAVAPHSLCPQASLMANCQAPRRPWLASHMSTVFISLLCFPSFLGAAVFLCYAIWQ